MSLSNAQNDTGDQSMGRHYVLVILIQVLELAGLAWLAATFR